MLHKSFFNQKKEPYAKLADIRSISPSLGGGVSPISHADEAAPAISLQSRNDDELSTGKDINNLLGKEKTNLLYPTTIDELKRKISQGSTGPNSPLNAT